MIDLRKCNVGDKLRIRLVGEVWDDMRKLPDGDVVTYIGHRPEQYFPHDIEYANGEHGSRADNGMTFVNNKLDSDPDVIEVL